MDRMKHRPRPSTSGPSNSNQTSRSPSSGSQSHISVLGGNNRSLISKGDSPLTSPRSPCRCPGLSSLLHSLWLLHTEDDRALAGPARHYCPRCAGLPSRSTWTTGCPLCPTEPRRAAASFPGGDSWVLFGVALLCTVNTHRPDTRQLPVGFSTKYLHLVERMCRFP